MSSNSEINPLRRFIKLLQLEKKDIYAIYFYAIVGGVLSMSLPLGIQSVIRFIQSGQITTSWLILIVLVIVGAILTGVMQIMQLRITENIQQRIFVRYSFEFAHRFPRFNAHSLGSQNPTELINRFFDVFGLQKGFSKVLIDFTSALLQIVFCLLVLSLYHPFYIAFSILLVSLLILIFRPYVKQGLETSLKESKYKYATAFWLQEITRSSWSFRTSSNETLSLNRLDESAANYIKSREKHFQILWKQFIWTIAFKVLIITSLLGLGGYLVISQQINLGQFVAAEVLILLILGAVDKVIQSMDNLYDVCTSLEKLEQVRDVELSFKENSTTEVIDLFPIDILRDDSAIQDTVVFELTKGESVFVRSKSNYQATQFLKQCIDHSVAPELTTRWNYRTPGPKELEVGYRNIGWFSSESQLVDASLLDNITLQRPGVNVETVKDVLNLFNVDCIYTSAKEGLDTPIRKLESTLTKEQKERLLIARAVVDHPELLLISFVDSVLSLEDQTAILQRITTLLPDATIVCTCDQLPDMNWKMIELNTILT